MEFFEKIIAVQTKLKAPKGQYNKFGGYNYRSCEDILEALKPLLAEYKLFINITDEVEMNGSRYIVHTFFSFSAQLLQSARPFFFLLHSYASAAV